MDVRTGACAHLRSRISHAYATVVFGSAVSQIQIKPASVLSTCEAIGLPRSTYYYQSRRSAAAIHLEQKIVRRLVELHAEHPTHGYRRMTEHLNSEGFHVNRKRVARLMQVHNFTGLAPPREQRSGSGRQRTDSVLRLQSATRPTAASQIWISDLAYVQIATQLVYSTTVIDAWSRDVVGYAVATHLNPRLPALALHSAVRAVQPVLGCIHHSTYGIQYLMRGYRALLAQYGLVPETGDRVQSRTVNPSSGNRPTANREIVSLRAYMGWDDVVRNPQEFIRALYTPQRMEAVLLGAVDYPCDDTKPTPD